MHKLNRPAAACHAAAMYEKVSPSPNPVPEVCVLQAKGYGPSQLKRNVNSTKSHRHATKRGMHELLVFHGVCKPARIVGEKPRLQGNAASHAVR